MESTKNSESSKFETSPLIHLLMWAQYLLSARKKKKKWKLSNTRHFSPRLHLGTWKIVRLPPCLPSYKQRYLPANTKKKKKKKSQINSPLVPQQSKTYQNTRVKIFPAKLGKFWTWKRIKERLRVNDNNDSSLPTTTTITSRNGLKVPYISLSPRIPSLGEFLPVFPNGFGAGGGGPTRGYYSAVCINVSPLPPPRPPLPA